MSNKINNLYLTSDFSWKADPWLVLKLETKLGN